MLDLVEGIKTSEAVGWTLIHSLWEGAIIAALLGALFISVRSPRVRYVVGSAALLAMLASFIVTLIHFLPERGNETRNLIKMTLPSWTRLPNGNWDTKRFSDFGALVPWLAPVWIVGVCIFYLRCALVGCRHTDGGDGAFVTHRLPGRGWSNVWLSS
jgi:hypothetical protein